MPETLLGSKVVGRREVEPWDVDDARLSLKCVNAGVSLLYARRPRRCPLDDHPVCGNVHFRSGNGFEHEKRCPHHEISWDPDNDVTIAVEHMPMPHPEQVISDVLVSSREPLVNDYAKDMPATERLLFYMQEDYLRVVRFTV